MKRLLAFVLTIALALTVMPTQALAAASDAQITKQGGGSGSTADNVTTSKTIEGTEFENVFDITLKVTTKTDIKTLTEDPDMAVVIVMDISNTMTAGFGNTTRYDAAMAAANRFVNLFRQDVGAKSATSKIGFVAFNTSATKIAGMTEVKTVNQATTFKNTYQSGTSAIIHAAGYGDSHSRFTNIEAGLKLGYDMIKDLPNQNKFIVFLSDGFPTTYIKSGYTGYDPYTPGATSYTTGQFYDAKNTVPCSYGTSYSERAAVKARQQATTIKNAGAEIFSIGVDVGGQTISGYDTHPHSHGFSVIDRPNTTSYEIGSASSQTAYENWLKGSATNNNKGIGSGYYYPSTNQQGMTDAFESIFEEMKTKTEERTAKAWQVSDPMGTNIEFIGFYDKGGTLQAQNKNLSGSFGAAKENTATYTSGTKTFNWNIQQSGYSLSSGTYTFTLKYRVRLTNEAASGFAEGTSYDTNGKTTLSYQTITTSGGSSSISPLKTLDFKVPAVKGYLGELTFTKKDNYGRTLAGAKFRLEHDTSKCNKCKGSNPNTSVANTGNLGAKEATSSSTGVVTFSKVPSGHTYKLTEVSTVDGYTMDTTTYKVTVAYDKVTHNIKADVVENPVIEYDITLLKVDASSTNQATPLSGAKFKLYSDSALTKIAKRPDGTTDVGEVTTGTDGKAALGKLMKGTYYMVETATPEGFEPIEGYITLTIDPSNTSKPVTAVQGTKALTVTASSTSLTATIKIPNNPGVEIPKTGGPGTALFTITGASLCMAAVVMYGLTSKRKQRKEAA